MSEIEDNPEIEKPKVLALITTTVLSGMLGVFILIIRANFYRPWWSEYVARNLELLLGTIGLITGYLAVIKLHRRKKYFILGVILLFLFFQVLPHTVVILFGSIACLAFVFITPLINSMDRWVYGIRGSFRKDMLVYSFTTIGLFLSGAWLAETCEPVSIEKGMGCSSNLQKLGKAVSIYQKNNHGKYPEPNIWCDSLLKTGQIDEYDFICPEVKFRWKRQFLPFPIPINRKCYYAINPACEPNSPPDTVLLFEIKGGWNESGGPELLSMENHHGSFCHVLFNNGNIERIYKTKQLANLRWNP